MPNWSESQIRAINNVGKNIVVSASAGSGKTAVLTARMVKRITQDRIPVNKLLAMTFTDAAASEMKNRLYNGLNEIIVTTNDEELKQYCIEQCATLKNAMICTIHSFCLSVIQENYFVINLSANLIKHIFSDEEMQLIQDEAIDKTLDDLISKDANAFNIVSSYFDSRFDSFENLKKTIIKISNVALNQQDKNQFFKLILDKAKLNNYNQLDPEISHYLFIRFNIEIQQIKDELEDCYNVAVIEQAEDTVLNNLTLKINHINNILDAVNTHNYRQFIHRLHSFAQVKSINTKIESAKIINKRISALNKTLQKMIAENFDEETFAKDNHFLYPIVQFLVESCNNYLINLDEIKLFYRGINFSDMEHIAYKILIANNYEVAKKYQKRFDEILVDEFQDTNDFQNSMIEMISRGNNIFRVGDIKQSIYRFRGAKPQIMNSLMKCNDETNEVIVLHHNYRSNKSIVEFNNLLFQQLMNISSLNNEFTDNDLAQVGLSSQDDNYSLPVQFIKVLKTKDSSDDNVKQVKANALILANKILDMINTTEFNKWSDYCILVRSHETKNDIRYVFDSLNIPYTTTVNSGLYNTFAVRICLSYLRLIVDYSNDIACVSVLTGLYNYSDEQLAKIHLTRNKSSFFKTVCLLDEQFKNSFEHIRQTSIEFGISSTIKEIIKINGFYWNHLNNQERANVDLFIQRVLNFETDNSNISIFLTQVDSSLDTKSSTAVSASKNDNVVQITTIHQSKGLQFPVVFFWSSSRTTINDDKESCLVDDKLGLGLHHIELPYRYKRPTLQQLAIKTKNTLEEFAENVRLYYVALTRAQKLGIILDSVSEDYMPSNLSLATFFKKKGSTDLILSTMNSISTVSYEEIFIDDSYSSSYVSKNEPQFSYQIPFYKHLHFNQETELSTPSNVKSSPLNTLHYNANKGSQYGTKLHKYIEVLPDKLWNEQLIKEVINEINQSDLQALLRLNQQPLFIEANKGKVTKEFAFAVKSETTITHGYIDFISIFDDKVLIIDFKSDSIKSSSELVEKYREQLNSYKECVRIIFPNKAVETYLYSFSINQFIQIL